MRICHITPHLPPEQAANALLPYHLGRWARDQGDEALFVAHPPRPLEQSAPAVPLPGEVTWIARRRSGLFGTSLRVDAVAAVPRIARAAASFIRRADVVHVHSNGLLAEIGALVARRYRKPVVLTLYGTEIWHYQPKLLGPDLFTRAYRHASHVTFYSQGLRHKAAEWGLERPETSVIYPPVAPEFEYRDLAGQAAARAALGIGSQHLLVNVKRLHPLAGQRYLIDALGEVIRTHPDTRLIVCGTGSLLGELKAAAHAARVEAHVTFAGLLENRTVALYDMAADAFVLPSLLEACPTVAVEALACGTPVISSDSPGGRELNALFGNDVVMVARENAHSLAAAIVELLDNKRRTVHGTRRVLEREFAPARVAAQFAAIYRRVLKRDRTSSEVLLRRPE